MKKAFLFVKDKYVNPKYPFQDRLYFLFGTAGVISAGAAFLAAIMSGLPMIAAVASLLSFFIVLALMIVSLFIKNISAARVICSIFLNFFMFPVLFWVTGGINCGMIFYFIMGLCIATLILNGKVRVGIVTATLLLDAACLYLGFAHPEWAYALSYSERQMDTVSSFLIVALFVIAVIMIMSLEYQKQHRVVQSYNEYLKHQLMTDTMTTLYNHSFLLTTLQEQMEICNQNNSPMSVAMFDIDGFKGVNDAYGHLRGNQVLCQFSAILKEASGEENIATRYGGDEFLVVLPGANHAKAFAFAEKVRISTLHDKALQELAASSISISGGVLQYKKDVTVDDFIHQVDTRMYMAKRKGKNQIVGNDAEPALQSTCAVGK
ncbi:MAG: GGDEF domain-containing protein [Clostridia bacterium]